MKFLVACLAALVLAGSAAAWTDNTTLDETASWLAGRPVTVHCLSRAEEAADGTMAIAYGYVWFNGTMPDDHMTVGHDICGPLLRWLKDGVHNTVEWRLALAVMVLTHESGHLRGMRDEAVTQCWAIRHVYYVARHLGFGEREARWIRNIALRIDASHNRNYPEYDLPGCKRPVVH